MISKQMQDAWMKERDETVISYDVDRFRKFYDKWRKIGVYGAPLPKNDLLIKITMRKMVYHITSFTKEQRDEAAKWLKDRGMSTEL